MLTLVARDSASADSSALSWAAPKGAQRVRFGATGLRGGWKKSPVAPGAPDPKESGAK
jgi:hypothetical protein